MAKQKGVIKIAGTLDDLSFYQQDGQYFARMKGGVSGDRIKNDPKYARTRENNSEFGRAGKAAKLVVKAFNSLVKGSMTRKSRSNLVQIIMKGLHADTTNGRGERTLQDGDLAVLDNFNFNVREPLDETIILDTEVAIDRAGGTMTVSTVDFIPNQVIDAPEGATHVKFVAAGSEVDFLNQKASTNVAESDMISLGDQSETGLSLQATVTAGSTLPLMLAFGVFFYQELNGVDYPLSNGSYNAVALIGIDVA